MAKIEQYNTWETAEAFPGMTPSQTLGFLFRDVICWNGDDLKESRHQVSRLRSWLRRDENSSQGDGWQKLLDRLDSKEEKGEREANRWFGLVVRRALVDEGLTGGDSLALAAEVERSWGKIERMGFGVEVNLRTGSVRLRQSDGNRVPKITAVQDDDTSKFGKAYGRLLKKYGPATLAGVGILSVVTGCVVPPVSVENTPVAEVTEVAASKSVAVILDREELSKIADVEAKKIVSDRLDQIKQYCEKGFGDKMEVGSEMYLLGVDEKGTPSIWGFCKAEIDGEMAMAVVYFDSADNTFDKTIYKKLMVFGDNSVGYEDNIGRHIILQHRPGNKYDVLDINGYVIVRWEDAGQGDDNSILTWMLNVGVTPVAAEAPTETPVPTPTPTLEPTATATATATATEVPLIQGDIFYNPEWSGDIKKVALAPSPFEEPEKYARWHEEYIKQINKKLENYNGPTVEITEISGDGGNGRVKCFSKTWPVVASYRYKWKNNDGVEEEVLSKTIILEKNSDGKGYVLLNVTYYPESSLKSFKRAHGYDTYGDLREYATVQYILTDLRQEHWPDAFQTAFFNTFPRTKEEGNVLFRFLTKYRKEGDGNAVSQMQFILNNGK